MNSKLFLVSEEGAVLKFEPHAAPGPNTGIEGSAVWVIDDDHLAHYLFPRDCPRITLRCAESTVSEDRKRFFRHGHERIIAVELCWYKRMQTTPLYIYEFSAEKFIPVPGLLGFYISRDIVTPLMIRKIANPLELIVDRGYKLRLLDSLWPLRDAVISSTVHYSLLGMRHANAKIKAA